MIKDDHRLSWMEVQDKNWPPVEKITKRLKRIVSETGKSKDPLRNCFN